MFGMRVKLQLTRVAQLVNSLMTFTTLGVSESSSLDLNRLGFFIYKREILKPDSRVVGRLN